jgi:hypothetical protein
MATRHSTKPTDIGTNRTGIATSAVDAARMIEAARRGPASDGGPERIAAFRAELSATAPPHGTVPPPASLKGAAKTMMKAMKGEKASVFVDKLAERLAFERTGVRLYDAVLAKLPASRVEEGRLTVEGLRRHRDEELSHVLLVKDAIEKLGADPTAMTPCADLVGVQGQGLVQSVTDPRTTLTQCLDTLLAAELIDNDGWKMLIAMAEAIGQDDLARRFTEALANEDQHLVEVREWLGERLEIQLGARMPSTNEFGEPAVP